LIVVFILDELLNLTPDVMRLYVFKDIVFKELWQGLVNDDMKPCRHRFRPLALNVRLLRSSAGGAPASAGAE
jgi:hypothetical protein